MRIGLLSDIHGNASALESVLDDASRRSVDRWLNLGDTFYGPLEPARTAHLLEAIGALTVKGNQDRLLHEASPIDAFSSPTLAHVLSELSPERIAELRTLPTSLLVDDGPFACHASPSSDVLYLLEDVSTGVPHVKPDLLLEGLVRELGAGVIVCGHTHIPRVVQLRSGTLIVNPGSVGLPAYSDETPNHHRIETFSPNAAYAILERHDNRWSVEQYSIPYDHDRAARQASSIGRTDWSYWLSSGRCRPAHESSGSCPDATASTSLICCGRQTPRNE